MKSAPPLASGVAPEFSLTTFEGQQIRLWDLRGKPVVINFWPSWCIPCRTEAPILERAWNDYRERGVVVLGLIRWIPKTPRNNLSKNTG